VITTTPRPIALLKKIIADPSTALTRAGTCDNRWHLSAAFVDDIITRYGGRRCASDMPNFYAGKNGGLAQVLQ
jgi:phage terminase large subunit-like protein